MAYVWVLRRLCVWDKIEKLFRYLSYLIKIKKNIGVGFRRGFFSATGGAILDPLGGQTNLLAF